MKNKVSKQDLLFKNQFEALELSLSDFDHKAHIRLAYIYLIQSSTDEALQLIRISLNRFLQHYGVDPSKYHETLTKAWILAVYHFMNKTEQADSADSFIEQNPEILDHSIIMTHYSADVLFSDDARQKFIEPNLDAIPRYDR